MAGVTDDLHGFSSHEAASLPRAAGLPSGGALHGERPWATAHQAKKAVVE